MKIGVHSISNSAYHADEGISSSGIKELIKSPAHYQAYLKADKKPTPEMVFGTLVHTLVLEPEKFEQEFAVGDFNVRRGKEYDKCVEENPGKNIISKEEYDRGLVVQEAVILEVSKNKNLERLLQGHKELSFYWKDEKTGILCKCRTDVLTPFGAINDVKTSYDASFDAFQNQMVKLSYFVSAAFYLRGVRETMRQSEWNLGVAPKVFSFTVIESKEPHAIATYYLDEKSIQMGDMLIDKALASLADAEKTNEWPSYSRQIIQMGLPSWAYFKMNKE